MFVGKRFKKDTSREIELMNEIAKADEISLINNNMMTEFYYRISVPAWSAILKIWVPPKNEDDVEDPFQDGWIKIIDKRKSYSLNSKPYPWCLKIFRNTVSNFFDLMNNKVSETGTSIKSGEEEGIVLISVYPATDFVARMNSIEKMIDEIIENDMQPLERKAIKMALKDYKQREIADELNMSVGACNKAIKHARDIIKNNLERNGINIEKFRYE